MRALSVRQPWAELIASGKKRIEYRSWSTDYRGPLCIVASLGVDADDMHKIRGATIVRGAVVCVVDLVDVRGCEGNYHWDVRKPVRCEPHAVKGKLSLWHIDDLLVVPIAGARKSSKVTSRAPSELESRMIDYARDDIETATDASDRSRARAELKRLLAELRT